MSVPYAIILLMTTNKDKWYKTFIVCDDKETCDASVLITFRNHLDTNTSFECPVCGSPMTVISQDKEVLLFIGEDIMESAEFLSLKQEMELRYGNDITELKNKLDVAEKGRTQAFQVADGYSLKINNLQEYLLENVGQIGEDYVKDIFEIFDMESEKEVEIEFTVRGNATLSVSIFADNEDIRETFNNAIDISSNESDMDISDFETDSFRVTS